MALFRKILDVIRLAGLPREEKKVVLFSEGNNHWTFVKPVASYLIKHKDTLKPIYITQSLADEGINYVQDHMDFFYVGSGAFRDFALNNLACDLVLTSTPDIGSFQVKRSPDCRHYAYVQHSLNSLHMAYREGAFNHYDTVFCGGEHHERELELLCQHYGLQPKSTIPMRYEPIAALKSDSTQRSSKVENVLLAPTWGEQSMIESGIAGSFIEQLLDLGKSVVLRPHPETTKLNYHLLDEIENTFKHTADFRLDLATQQLRSLQEADVLVTDWSGVAFDFALGLGRPVIFVNTQPKIKNAKYQEIAESPIELRCRSHFGFQIDSAKELVGTFELLENPDWSPNFEFENFYDAAPESALDELMLKVLN